jgi:hypothetical protein
MLMAYEIAHCVLFSDCDPHYPQGGSLLQIMMGGTMCVYPSRLSKINAITIAISLPK